MGECLIAQAKINNCFPLASARGSLTSCLGRGPADDNVVLETYARRARRGSSYLYVIALSYWENSYLVSSLVCVLRNALWYGGSCYVLEMFVVCGLKHDRGHAS